MVVTAIAPDVACENAMNNESNLFAQMPSASVAVAVLDKIDWNAIYIRSDAKCEHVAIVLTYCTHFTVLKRKART